MFTRPGTLIFRTDSPSRAPYLRQTTGAPSIGPSQHHSTLWILANRGWWRKNRGCSWRCFYGDIMVWKCRVYTEYTEYTILYNIYIYIYTLYYKYIYIYSYMIIPYTWLAGSSVSERISTTNGHWTQKRVTLKNFLVKYQMASFA